MRDSDIRKYLREYLADLHREQAALIVDELRMCQGEARIDLAVFNASLSGFEIKSERDTLARLPGQLKVYTAVCDYVTLVVSEKHAVQVAAHLPSWCGLLIARQSPVGEIFFFEEQESHLNPSVDSRQRAQLLWRSEAIAILEARGMLRGLRSKPRYQLWESLATLLDGPCLNQEIVKAIKLRGDWRSDRQRAQCDETPLLSPM